MKDFEQLLVRIFYVISEFATVAHELGSQRIMKMGCVVREPLHRLAAQPRETAIFEGEPSGVQVANTYLREYEPEERVTLAERTLVSSVSLYAALGGDITP